MAEIPMPEEIKNELIRELRGRVHAEMDTELERRIVENPIPTDDELRIGAFREELEPQVRDAIFEFFKKGYATESSGFYGDGQGGEIQAIDGYFSIDEETEEKLKPLGAKVLRGPETGLPWPADFTKIQFVPAAPDLAEMKRKWDAIADVFPERKSPAPPSKHGLDFLRQYAPSRIDVEEKIISRLLEKDDFEPSVAKQLADRLAEIQKSKQ